MYLEEVNNCSTSLKRILERLDKVYGIDLNLQELSLEEIHAIDEEYTLVKYNLLVESSYNSYLTHPEYTKAFLICEAIRLFLSEYAPVRKDKKVRSKNKVKENSELLATKMMEELDSPRSVGNLMEAARNAALSTDSEINEVISAYKATGMDLIKEYKEPEDPVYHKAMLFALDMIGNSTYRKFLNDAQQHEEDSQQLFDFLINKGNKMGLGEKSRQFAYAAYNALMNVKLNSFAVDRPVWENN